MANTMKKIGIALFLSATVVMTATPAMAHRKHHGGHHQSYYDNGYYENARYEDRGYDDRRYDRNNRYNDGYRCKPKGTGGLVIGAVVGGLLGREVVGRRGDRTAGTIVGAGAGALAGRALHRAGSNRC